MGNPIIKQFKMRRNGGEASRASEVSPNSYSMNQERTMANMGMIDSGMNMGTPMNYGTPIKKTEGENFLALKEEIKQRVLMLKAPKYKNNTRSIKNQAVNYQ